MLIGIFDSGIGGVSVLHEAVKLLPNEHFIFYADSDRSPYGTKTSEEVKSYLVTAGIPSQDIVATGKGGDEPLVPNTTPDNRMKNNRIEVFVYSYDAPAQAANPASKQNNVQQVEPAPKKKCKERDMANNKLGECYSYAEGSKDHRRCMAAYKNLLNLANSKCK